YKYLKAWIVTGLYENSPAHKQGLKIDDKIIAVNKIPVSQLDFKSGETFLDGLSDIELTVKRGAKELKFRFPLKEPF
ncbi:MAG: PDZ domain-containing protein, partial [Bacteroidales bacterium]|nr:PDZ domain-containing protein [Bacteroidales bacterium]